MSDKSIGLAAAFSELDLSPATLEILEQRNYQRPTPIQAMVIPKLSANERDMIAQAQTGTGKTAAYALPIIEKLLQGKHGKQPRAIILAPTRELAMQITQEIELFIGSRQLKAAALYGGQPIEIQLRALKGGVDIAVGTPGRILDLMERSALKLDFIEFAVLDEADEMLDMGFVEDIENILSATPQEKRMLMFSATVPAEARKIAENFMVDAEYVVAPVTDAEKSEPLTEQWACEVRREDKFNALKRILNAEGRIYGMIFCRTRSDVDELTMNLQKNKFRAEALHGELTQNQRTRVIEQFKAHRFDMLVATDVAARGIDINDLTHVINYSLPTDKDIYTHRIGRTGRAGKKGVAISLFTPAEGGRFAMLRKASAGHLEQRALPDAKAIIAAKKSRFRDEAEALMPQVNNAYLRMAEELTAVYDPEILIAALLEMKFHKELLHENYPPLGRGKRERAFGSDRGSRGEKRTRSDRAERSASDRDRGKRPPRHRSKEQTDFAGKSEKNTEVFKEKKHSVNVENTPRDNGKSRSGRPNLRDWALELTAGDAEFTKRKGKKRKDK